MFSSKFFNAIHNKLIFLLLLRLIKRHLNIIKMKKLLLFSIFLVVQNFYAQQQLDLTVRFNTSNSKYEVFAKPNFTQNNFTWGPSQISVLVPESFPNQALLITSHAAGSWGDNSIVYAPSASSNYDFHGLDTSGALTNFVANQEKLIFSFLSPTGTCISGVRLYVNGTDPDSSQPGMSGGDFSNTINNGSQDVYNSNYDNGGISCAALSNEEIVFTEMDIKAYPNPVVDFITFSGLITDKNSIEVYAYNGKLLKTFETTEKELKVDFSNYADGVYFVRITNTENNYSVEKIIKNPR